MKTPASLSSVRLGTGVRVMVYTKAPSTIATRAKHKATVLPTELTYC